MTERKWKTELQLTRGDWDSARAGRWCLHLHKVNGGYHVVVWHDITKISAERLLDINDAHVLFVELEREIMVNVAMELFDANA